MGLVPSGAAPRWLQPWPGGNRRHVGGPAGSPAAPESGRLRSEEPQRSAPGGNGGGGDEAAAHNMRSSTWHSVPSVFSATMNQQQQPQQDLAATAAAAAVAAAAAAAVAVAVAAAAAAAAAALHPANGPPAVLAGLPPQLPQPAHQLTLGGGMSPGPSMEYNTAEANEAAAAAASAGEMRAPEANVVRRP